MLVRQIAATEVGKFQKVTDLPTATLGVARDGPLDGSLLAPVLDYYGLSRDKKKFLPVNNDQNATANRTKKNDSIIAVGPVTSI